MTRKALRKKIQLKMNKIIDLKEEIEQLVREDYLLCDKEQWYEEENITTGRGKTKQTNLIGFVCWIEDFKDEFSDSVITIPRRHEIKCNGLWIDGIAELKISRTF